METFRAAGNAPKNKADAHVEKRVLDHFHTRTKVMPETLNNHVYRKCEFEGDGADLGKVSIALSPSLSE